MAQVVAESLHDRIDVGGVTVAQSPSHGRRARAMLEMSGQLGDRSGALARLGQRHDSSPNSDDQWVVAGQMRAREES